MGNCGGFGLLFQVLMSQGRSSKWMLTSGLSLQACCVKLDSGV